MLFDLFNNEQKNNYDESPLNKNPGPEDQALVIPRGDLLCWSFIDLLKFQIFLDTKIQGRAI